MGKILILGGSRYFGKRLVNLLAKEGTHDVTVATRGLTQVEYEGPVRHLALDRKNADELYKAAAAGPWDVVYDNICYSPDEALAAASAFNGFVGRYILTSTLGVYDKRSHRLSESDFDPYRYELRLGGSTNFDYAEGKRLAEAAFFQQAEFPVSAMRIPIVLGTDDYTRRLHFHVEHILQGIPLGLPSSDASMSFISSAEAASFLHFLGTSSLTGPVNASSNGEITIGRIIALIEEITGKQAIILPETDEANQSPFGMAFSYVMDNAKARAAGFSFADLDDWLPKLIGEITAELT